ncbi:MAG: tyrosine-type recombinase/integrase [Candidatus Wallbacteria bacterium]|nr:tyrosine-type recombinase/integrase [Candidatus Wallbacteria bacterium]
MVESELTPLMDEYRQQREAEGQRPGTLDSLARGLRAFKGFLAERDRRSAGEIRSVDVLDFRTWMMVTRPQVLGLYNGKHPRIQTALRTLTVVRGFCRWLVQRGLLLIDPTATLEPVRYVRPPRRVLTPEEVDRLLNTARARHPVDLRDRAILELLYSSALRSGELVRLDLADLDLCQQEVIVRHGKGDKYRRLPVGGSAARALDVYLDRGRPGLELLGRKTSEALFLCRKGTRLSQPLVQRMVQARARQAGLPPDVTPHALRHSAVCHMLAKGASVRHLQELLGHEDLNTTAHYTRLTIADLKACVKRHHPRGRGEA